MLQLWKTKISLVYKMTNGCLIRILLCRYSSATLWYGPIHVGNQFTEIPHTGQKWRSIQINVGKLFMLQIISLILMKIYIQTRNGNIQSEFSVKAEMGHFILIASKCIKTAQSFIARIVHSWARLLCESADFNFKGKSFLILGGV